MFYNLRSASFALLSHSCHMTPQSHPHDTVDGIIFDLYYSHYAIFFILPFFLLLVLITSFSDAFHISTCLVLKDLPRPIKKTGKIIICMFWSFGF